MEKWTENDRSIEETKYCNILESLKKNEKVKEFVMTQLAKKTDREMTVESILNVMKGKYLRTMGEKLISVMKEMC